MRSVEDEEQIVNAVEEIVPRHIVSTGRPKGRLRFTAGEVVGHRCGLPNVRRRFIVKDLRVIPEARVRVG